MKKSRIKQIQVHTGYNNTNDSNHDTFVTILRTNQPPAPIETTKKYYPKWGSLQRIRDIIQATPPKYLDYYMGASYMGFIITLLDPSDLTFLLSELEANPTI